MSGVHGPSTNTNERIEEGERISPKLTWDLGTAYDFFLSLAVLHEPEKHGLRASWAAGVRSRLSSAERKTLETAHVLDLMPVHWIHTLPEPKDATSVLWALRQIPPAERLLALTLKVDKLSAVMEVLQRVAEQGTWGEQEQDELRTAFRQTKHDIPRPKNLVKILEAWSRPEEFGEKYLAALQSYQEAFFAEEEKQIVPALKKRLEEAQELAERLSLAELVEELSQGVQIRDYSMTPKLVLAPSYWITPLILFHKIGAKKTLFLFGARPPDVSLVPGELVPDMLLRVLKAMADPTRLRILRYLAHEQLTPSQLANRLRLRAPTVTHHLNTLRLAGLVRLTLETKGEKHYEARLEAIQALDAHLQEFLESDLEK